MEGRDRARVPIVIYDRGRGRARGRLPFNNILKSAIEYMLEDLRLGPGRLSAGRCRFQRGRYMRPTIEGVKGLNGLVRQSDCAGADPGPSTRPAGAPRATKLQGRMQKRQRERIAATS